MNHHITVTSLDCARRLKELGVPQDSHTYYNHENGFLQVRRNAEDHIDAWLEKRTSVYSAGELGFWLPYWIMTNEWGKVHFDQNEVFEDQMALFKFVGPHLNSKYRKNEAELHGWILVYLLENKLIEIRTCRI